MLFSALVNDSESLDFRAKLDENLIFTDLECSYDRFESFFPENLFQFSRRIDKKAQMGGRIAISGDPKGIF